MRDVQNDEHRALSLDAEGASKASAWTTPRPSTSWATSTYTLEPPSGGVEAGVCSGSALKKTGPHPRKRVAPHIVVSHDPGRASAPTLARSPRNTPSMSPRAIVEGAQVPVPSTLRPGRAVAAI